MQNKQDTMRGNNKCPAEECQVRLDWPQSLYFLFCLLFNTKVIMDSGADHPSGGQTDGSKLIPTACCNVQVFISFGMKRLFAHN